MLQNIFSHSQSEFFVITTIQKVVVSQSGRSLEESENIRIIDWIPLIITLYRIYLADPDYLTSKNTQHFV